jgi:hypothetical protein
MFVVLSLSQAYIENVSPLIKMKFCVLSTSISVVKLYLRLFLTSYSTLKPEQTHSFRFFKRNNVVRFLHICTKLKIILLN